MYKVEDTYIKEEHLLTQEPKIFGFLSMKKGKTPSFDDLFGKNN